jgi:glycosyltransferase involved in cell wall biosynthesis
MWDDKYFYQQGNFFFKGLILLKSTFKRLKDILKANDYDFIFIQREAFFLGTTFFEQSFARSRAKVIFDFDDSIWLNQISSNAPNKKLNFLKKPSKISEIIALSDLIVVGNKYLSDYALRYNKNVRVIPTTIDTDHYTPVKTSSEKVDKIIIGWSGSKTTIDHFREAIPALEYIKRKYRNNIEIKIIGDVSFRHDKIDAVCKDWKFETEIDDLRTFHIGIMPLPDDDWSRGKCGLKGLQYMSLAIPTIMSPVGVNQEIISHGENGLLASSTEEWINSIENLVNDKSLREKLGEAGRQTVVKNYSVSSNSANFLSLFS